MAVEIPEKKVLSLEGGDIPALEIQHVGKNTMLRFLDNKGVVLAQASLSINEACDLACAVQNEHYEMLSDDDDWPPQENLLSQTPDRRED